jgi:REP element-mobilizing transposase RayT
MPPEPQYHPKDLPCAYQLRYSWTGWPSQAAFRTDLIARIVPAIASEWETDGIRVLESRFTSDQMQLTLSTTPQVNPVTMAARVKGRIQHHCRRAGSPIDFSRKVAVRSLGDATRDQVEEYIRSQVANEELADERLRTLLAAYTVSNPAVDLSQPTQSNSGRYWYNLHLVLVTSERYRLTEPALLERIRDTTLRICVKKGYAASRLAVLPDHLHIALRGTIGQSPEEIALAFLNNLAFALDQRRWWQAGYYVGTFGEYTMAAARSQCQGL